MYRGEDTHAMQAESDIEALTGDGKVKIYIESYGCTRRKLDATKFHTYFSLNGYHIVDNPEEADYILVTTCAFKKAEEEHSLSVVDGLKKYKAKVLVYGCLPDIAPEKYHKIADYQYLSTKNIHDIDRYFEGIRYPFSDIRDANRIPVDIKHTSWAEAVVKFFKEFEFSPIFLTRVATYLYNRTKRKGTGYYLSTSRGCLGRCSYCAIRYAVGTIRSKPIDTVLREFLEGFEAGHRNFILVGDDVGAYGIDRGERFPQLLSRLIDEVEKLDSGTPPASRHSSRTRLHVEEIHPKWLVLYGDELAGLLSSHAIKSILCPVQSGNDRVLGLMEREHDAVSARTAIAKIRAANPDVSLTTQIIVGFPTETEQEFEDTLRHLEDTRFDDVIVFPYDDKENTIASGIYPKVPENVIQARVKKACYHLRKKGIRAYLSCQ